LDHYIVSSPLVLLPVIISLCSSYSDKVCNNSVQFYSLRDEVCYPGRIATTPSSPSPQSWIRYTYPFLTRYYDSECSNVILTQNVSSNAVCTLDGDGAASTSSLAISVDGSGDSKYQSPLFLFPTLFSPSLLFFSLLFSVFLDDDGIKLEAGVIAAIVLGSCLFCCFLTIMGFYFCGNGSEEEVWEDLNPEPASSA
jgi:hypothetical protein